jgi:signal recognition particle receptor subunit beta
MSLVNYSTREITCKIVYYGPGRSGKTSNLQYVHAFVPEERKGPMVSLATETDRTLFFDFLPIDLGSISGFRTRIQLYTVPGQVYYNATRKLVLRGADGVVFVADSQRERTEENLESFRNLHENLLEEGIPIRDFPLVMQYNKRDLPGVMPINELDELLNYAGAPAFPASAIEGVGVFDTLKSASQLVLQSLSKRLRTGTAPGSRG